MNGAPSTDLKKARLDRIFGDDDMFRFRLGGKKRLWGFRKGRQPRSYRECPLAWLRWDEGSSFAGCGLRRRS